MSYAGPSSQLYLGPLSQASHPSTGTLYPATVLQLLRAEQPHLESKFILDGIKLDRVTCVACIADIREYDVAKAYILEDGSAGRLRVFLGSETFQDFGTQVYVRVMGRLKVYNGVNQLNAEQIRPVLDMHEFFFHCLEAIVAFVSNPSIPRVSQSAPPSQLTTSVVSQSPPSTQLRATQTNSRSEGALTQNLGHLGLDFDTTLEALEGLTLNEYSIEDLNELGFLQEPSFTPQSPPQSPSLLSTDPPSEADNQPTLILDPYSSLTSLQRDIIIQIHDNVPHYPDGVPIPAMYRLVGDPTVGQSQIRQAIEDLMDSGHIYSTNDGLLNVMD